MPVDAVLDVKVADEWKFPPLNEVEKRVFQNINRVINIADYRLGNYQYCIDQPWRVLDAAWKSGFQRAVLRSIPGFVIGAICHFLGYQRACVGFVWGTVAACYVGGICITGRTCYRLWTIPDWNPRELRENIITILANVPDGERDQITGTLRWWTDEQLEKLGFDQATHHGILALFNH